MSAKKRVAANALPELKHLNESDIAQRAYQHWIARGCPISDGREDWFSAEAELRAEHAPTKRHPVRSALRRLGI